MPARRSVGLRFPGELPGLAIPRRFLPERPTDDARLRIEYLERVSNGRAGAGDDLYFYGGVVVAGSGRGA